MTTGFDDPPDYVERQRLEHNRRTLGYACGDPDCSLNTEEEPEEAPLRWSGWRCTDPWWETEGPVPECLCDVEVFNHPAPGVCDGVRQLEEKAMARPDYGTIREPDPMAVVDATPPPMDTLGAMIQWEEDELDAEGTLKLFSRLVETGEAWSLQGTYGRQARSLIDAGFLDPVHGAITEKGQEVITAPPI